MPKPHLNPAPEHQSGRRLRGYPRFQADLRLRNAGPETGDLRDADGAEIARQPYPQQLWKTWAITLGLGLLWFAALKADLPLALYFLQERCPKVIREFVELFEAFSHAFGVLMILVTIYWLDPKSRSLLPRIGCAAIVGGLSANVGKLLISRVRPKYFDFVGGVDSTFGVWLPFTNAGTNGQSFPSAHSATAFALAAALAWHYPRGRWLFAFMAAMAGLQRVAGYAHFLSDSFWGASIGWFVGSAFLHWPRLAKHFDRLEIRLSGRSYQTPDPQSRQFGRPPRSEDWRIAA